jgi:CheY-like chemotaxis protein
VVEAETGEQALQTIEDERPHAVVLDLRLPGITGQEVARRVRANPDLAIASTPLLACSASVQPEVRSDALEAGCDDFEPKPFDVRTFPARIRDLMARKGRTAV